MKTNNYDMDKGEPSVFDKELLAAKEAQAKKKGASRLVFVPQTRKQVAGRDYDSQDLCQMCWHGGELICCDLCPAALHCECMGLDDPPTAKAWCCPHHACKGCERKTSAAGLLFRCDMCAHAYCEDCVPTNCTILGVSERYEALGYRLSSSACYVHCSEACSAFANKLLELQQYQSEHGGDVFPDWWEGREVDEKDALGKKIPRGARWRCVS